MIESKLRVWLVLMMVATAAGQQIHDRSSKQYRSSDHGGLLSMGLYFLCQRQCYAPVWHYSSETADMLYRLTLYNTRKLALHNDVSRRKIPKRPRKCLLICASFDTPYQITGLYYIVSTPNSVKQMFNLIWLVPMKDMSLKRVYAIIWLYLHM